MLNAMRNTIINGAVHHVQDGQHPLNFMNAFYLGTLGMLLVLVTQRTVSHC
jgi:hypothetical protein